MNEHIKGIGMQDTQSEAFAALEAVRQELEGTFSPGDGSHVERAHAIAVKALKRKDSVMPSELLEAVLNCATYMRNASAKGRAYWDWLDSQMERFPDEMESCNAAGKPTEVTWRAADGNSYSFTTSEAMTAVVQFAKTSGLSSELATAVDASMPKIIGALNSMALLAEAA